jgi:hypothetical protein
MKKNNDNLMNQLAVSLEFSMGHGGFSEGRKTLLLPFLL